MTADWTMYQISAEPNTKMKKKCKKPQNTNKQNSHFASNSFTDV